MKAHFKGLAPHEIRAKARDILSSGSYESITEINQDKMSEKITESVSSLGPQIKRQRLGQREEF